MINRIFFFLLVLLVSKSAKTIDYQTYNKLISQAMKSMSEKNYSNADILYDSAFKINPKPQAIDMQNALFATLESQNTTKGICYANKLAALGVGRYYFEKNERFRQLQSNKEWNALLKTASQAKMQFKLRNKKLLLQLLQLQNSANVVRDEYVQSFHSSKDQKNFIEKRDSLAHILIQLFKEYGYLSEYKIGVNIENDTTISDPLFTDILILKSWYPSPPELFEVVEDGTIRAILIQNIKDGLVDINYAVRIGYNSISPND